jgi:hypothetical protein
LLSWLILRAKCRYCKSPISPRYFVIELLTGSVFLGVYLVYFHGGIRGGMGEEGAWFVYALHLVLIGAFIAASGIDLELWIIRCRSVVRHGGGSDRFGGGRVPHRSAGDQGFRPSSHGFPPNGAIALGAAVGLGIGWLLLRTGVLKRSTSRPRRQARVRRRTTTAGRRARGRSMSRNTITGSKPFARSCSCCRSSSVPCWRSGFSPPPGASEPGGAA